MATKVLVKNTPPHNFEASKTILLAITYDLVRCAQDAVTYPIERSVKRKGFESAVHQQIYLLVERACFSCRFGAPQRSTSA